MDREQRMIKMQERALDIMRDHINGFVKAKETKKRIEELISEIYRHFDEDL